MNRLLPIAVSAVLATLACASPAPWGGLPAPSGPSHNGKICTVNAYGNQKDDTPQILDAFSDCNNGGTVVFPEGENYWVATKLNPIIYDVKVEWRGIWTVRLIWIIFEHILRFACQ
jgi:galacturan 1,4-alpha-galacturonidase